MSNLRRLPSITTAALVLLGLGSHAFAQISPPRVRFPSEATGTPTLPPTAAPSLAPPPSTLSPAPGFGAPPPASFGGSIAPATPGFDPYADPTLPQQPYYTPGSAPPFNSDPNCLTCPPLAQQATHGQWPRFLQQIRFRGTWMPRNGTEGLGFTTAELSATFLVPFLFNQNAPLLITPGFVTHFADGPSSATGADLPARLYDAFVDVAWTPQVTQYVSADLGFRVGAFSDFDKWTTKAMRYQGRGFAVIRTNDTHEWRAGVVYLDRNHIKLLPAGGLIWQPGGPTGNVRWEILFPNPKLAFRLNTVGNTEVWWYIAGEYGGDDWTIRRQNGSLDQVTYEDIRLLIGIESIGYRGFRGMLEAGWVTRRRLDYFSNNLDYKPGDTFMVRGGLTY